MSRLSLLNQAAEESPVPSEEHIAFNSDVMGSAPANPPGNDANCWPDTGREDLLRWRDESDGARLDTTHTNTSEYLDRVREFAQFGLETSAW